jgi:PIN domain nuclease of toxin-antitoxin system
LGSGVTALVLDTHVLHWWSAEPSRVSQAAAEAMAAAEELVVADISWYELARLGQSERIVVAIPIGNWLQRLARLVRTVPISVEIAAAAAALPSSFPGDPADRLIYATAIENGWRLVSKDKALREFRHPTQVVIW